MPSSAGRGGGSFRPSLFRDVRCRLGACPAVVVAAVVGRIPSRSILMMMGRRGSCPTVGGFCRGGCWGWRPEWTPPLRPLPADASVTLLSVCSWLFFRGTLYKKGAPWVFQCLRVVVVVACQHRHQ